MEPRHKAHEVPAGSLVWAELAAGPALCLKAERLGRDFLNHYLVPLDPLPAGREAIRLVYVDPWEEVAGLAAGLRLAHGPAEDGAAAAVGAVLITPAGAWLKVLDTDKTERSFAYVDLASGMVRQRQERHVIAVASWRLEPLP